MIRPGRSSRTAEGVTCLVGLGVGSLWWVLAVHEQMLFGMTVVDLALFVLAAAVMERLPIRQPGGRALPSSLAVVSAAAALGAAPPVVAFVAAGGWSLARIGATDSTPMTSLLLRAAGGWALAGVAAIGARLGPGIWIGDVPVGTEAAFIDPGAAVAITLALVVGAPAADTMVHTIGQRRYLLRRMGEAVGANALVGASIASTAILGTLVHPVLDHWTLPTMLIPLLAARAGLDRFALAARAYDQTIRAMSRLPEHLGGVDPDHGVRVGELAHEVALELGIDAATAADLVRAAHLHELGRIDVERDEPAGHRELAHAGARIIQRNDSLTRVARIVEAHGDLGGALAAEPGVSIPARIVAACCEIDRYAPDPDAPAQRQEVLVRLVRDIGDLDVVSALNRVLDR